MAHLRHIALHSIDDSSQPRRTRIRQHHGSAQSQVVEIAMGRGGTMREEVPGPMMTSLRRLAIASASAALGVACMVGAPATADAAPSKKAPAAWCGDGFEALPGDVCHIDGRAKNQAGGKRTLVIWLHGLIGTKTDWSQKHQKMLQRVAKASNVEVLFPKAPEIPGNAYGWPGTAEAQKEKEGALIDQWMAAKTTLEKRDNKSYDEVFVFGFSSGAYFASSLAMRGRLDVDGYAVFAGGQPMPAQPPVTHYAPVFVGVCADDPQTANHSRSFGGSLAGAGIPRMVSEQHVGHGLSEVHWAQAIAYLRRTMKPHTMPV